MTLSRRVAQGIVRGIAPAQDAKGRDMDTEYQRALGQARPALQE